jgi:hypothetical protein
MAMALASGATTDTWPKMASVSGTCPIVIAAWMRTASPTAVRQ